jgi:hypothetical protein
MYTINGIPYTNTLGFVMEMHNIFARQEDTAEQLLLTLDPDLYERDAFEHLSLTQSVHWRHKLTDWEDMRRHRGNRIGVRKRKEVK